MFTSRSSELLDRHETSLYVIGPKHDARSPVKIGVARNVLKRLRTMQDGNHVELEVLAAMRCSAAQEELIRAFLVPSQRHGGWYERDERVSELIDWITELASFEVLARVARALSPNQ